MAVATVAPNFQVDFLTTFDIGALLLGTVTIATGTTFRITYDNGDYDQFTGTGFVYDVDGVPIDGTLTGITGVRSGVTVYTVTGFTMPATTLVDYAVADDTQGALADIFDGNDSLKGSNFGDYIIGYDGNDTINGAGGDDSMEGGVGNDTYIADSINDFVFEDAGGGSDTIMSSSDYFLDLNVEKLVLTGTAPIGALGNEQDNLIIGNSGNNFIDGDAGDDTLDGGAGNDALFGWTGDDKLIGGAGNDILLGEEGIDTLQGGTGKDFYVYNPSIDGADVVITGEKGLDFVILDDNDPNDLLQFYDWDFDRVGNDLLITAYVDEADSDNGFDATQSLRIKDQYAGASIAFFDVNLGELNSFYTAFSDFTRVFTPGGLTGTNQGGDAELIVGTDLGEKISGNGGHTDWLFGEGGNDTITGGGLAGDSGWLYGGKGNDSLQGGAGNDNLRGDEGNDTLNGGAENPNLETLFLGDRADFRGSADGVTVDLTKQGTPQFVSTDQGTDTLIEIENVRGSDFADVITGDGGRNWLAGRDGNDSLVGNGGADVLEGEGGNDTLTGGAGDDELYGGDGDDLIQGGEGFDFLWGSKGNDTLDGGALEGQDEITYYSDPAGIIANLSSVEQSGVAAGTVKDGFGNTDTLVNIAGVLGSFSDDLMIGNDDYNYFEGSGGNDTLVGGGGSDGLDFFNAEAAVVVDLNKQGGVPQNFGFGLGSDSVSGFEEAYGTFFNDNLIGDGKDNFLIGHAGNDSLAGNAGDDTLRGDSGIDTLAGGDGNDMADYRWAGAGVTVDLNKQGALQLINTGEGSDLLTGIEDVRGSSFNDRLTGNGVANALLGLAGNDTLSGGGGADTLDGGAGNDAMSGGAGDDLYIVDSKTDIATEVLGAGSDKVQSTVSYVLSANVEDLELLGVANIDATGNASNNKLTGNDGNNLLDGKAGDDTMIGGLGNDTYVIDKAGDVADETGGGGIDTIKTLFTTALDADFENLTLTGTLAVNGTGNLHDNVIIGNSAANVLTGQEGHDSLVGGGGNDKLDGGIGSDTLDGGAGADSMIGGLGDDTFVIDSVGDKVSEEAGQGTDTVNSTVTVDLTLPAFANIEYVTLIGAGAVNAIGNVDANKLTGNTGANKLDGGAGDDTLIGGAGNDTLIGGPGSDSLAGGDGSDTYFVSIGDTVSETNGTAAGGIDLVSSDIDFTLGSNIEKLTLTGGAISGTGNTLANTITGNINDNILDGQGGKDTLVGGAGNDTYFVDMVGDVVTESLAGTAGGTDTVKSAINYTLGANLENLVLIGAALTGTGNALANELTGNGEANKLLGLAGNDELIGNAGNDTLDGGTGNDSLIGGDGDDLYIQDSALDVITETGSSDTGDELRTNQSTLTDALAGIEHYTFTGTTAVNFTGSDADNRITGTAYADTLDGGAGDDTLNGGAGADRLVGGLGDDTYKIDNVGDKISDSGGIDTVQSSISFVLADGLENLMLTGTAISGTGNALDNVITGNTAANKLLGGDGTDTLMGGAGNDTLDGGIGNDSLVGGAGTDTLVVSSGNDSISYTSVLDGHDIVTGFDGDATDGQDTLDLDALFDSLGVAESDRAGSVNITDLGTTVEVRVNTGGAPDFDLFVATLNTADAITVGQDIIVGS